MSIPYAKAGGPPEDWKDLRVFNLDTGLEVRSVTEVNTAEGWVVRMRRDLDGGIIVENGEIATERLEGRFAIRRIP